MKHDFIDENAREQLSALLDGELDGDAARFLQRRLQHDDALVGQLVRWQLAGDVLRAGARTNGEGDLATRVRAAIEREQTRAKPKRRGWMVWGGGLAAVAALGIAALNLPGGVDPASVPAAKEVATAPNTAAVAPTPSAGIAASAEAKKTKPSSPAAEVSGSAQRRVADAAPRHRQRETAAGVSDRVSADSQDAAQTVASERVVAVATTAPAKTRANRNPFTMQAAAPQSEPAWPKAVLPGFNSGLNADFRSDGNAGNPFMPHRTFDPAPLPSR